jgi:putative transposase
MVRGCVQPPGGQGSHLGAPSYLYQRRTDNAMCESFFATLECELLARRRFRTPIEARLAVFDFLESWYNFHRRHSALGYLSPAEFERVRQAA